MKIFFDVSTTVRFLAQDLNKKVTVVIHSIDNFNVLSEKSNVFASLINPNSLVII